MAFRAKSNHAFWVVVPDVGPGRVEMMEFELGISATRNGAREMNLLPEKAASRLVRLSAWGLWMLAAASPARIAHAASLSSLRVSYNAARAARVSCRAAENLGSIPASR